MYVDTWRLVFVLVVERFIAMHARWSSEELGLLPGQTLPDPIHYSDQWDLLEYRSLLVWSPRHQVRFQRVVRRDFDFPFPFLTILLPTLPRYHNLKEVSKAAQE